jgi:nicotinamidase-related amidase
VSHKAALLVIDVQRIYMEPEPMVTCDGDDLIAKCRSLIGKARSAGVPIVFVQHCSDDQPDDAALVNIHPDLEPAEGEPIVEKRFGSAFFRTKLEQTLTDLGVDTLYFCGLATFGCVNATVMCAICHDFDVRVVRNAHGTNGFDRTTPAEVVEMFNATWERAGAKLVRETDTSF